ncbi:hypothetical protein GCM10023210_43440 [Chryseobacterium ginsengisoli]|uniref:Lipocalin-like domain-containing protein n=1 Tax=Chryseobacterium ginsengisoli TaxID=363853 RepID=A0ABP9N0F3_9FLAO
MKLIVVFLTMVTVNIMAQSEQFSFLGKWQLIEYQGNDGANDYTQKIKNGEVLTFEHNNIVKDSLNTIGKYQFVGDYETYGKKLVINLNNHHDYYLALFNNKSDDVLYLLPTNSQFQSVCDEGCSYKYIRLKDEAKKSDPKHTIDVADEINTIKYYIENISKNNNLKIINDKDSNQHIIKFYEASGTLVKISESESTILESNTSQTDYYFKDDNLVYFTETKTNSSRMGACGAIKINISAFFYNESLIGSEVQKSTYFNSCYPVKLEEENILDQTDKLKQRFKQLIQLKK